MADQIDQANDLNEQHLERSLRAARQPIAVGVPGECDNCGDDSPRLVGGRCARCRDGRPR
ncbi:conjugal transfer protein TraR [Sphingomonas azotifigens]|uniref:conjugal transfer protein TraR n=1 Tax=Sphingomonas azotifigens TaxID=330920 RepID=UPI000A01E36B|nr:conjugal transfer protein TraR [Sphingomonas azotifigens]